MPTPLSKETAITLSFGTIFAVGAVVVGGAIWGNNKLHELQELQKATEDQSAIIASMQSTVATQNQTLAAIRASTDITRCREEEIKRIIARTVDTMNQLAVIMEQTPQFAVSRAMPQFEGIRLELANWKC